MHITETDPLLLAAMWPSERVLLGLQTSKVIRAALFNGTTTILIRPKTDAKAKIMQKDVAKQAERLIAAFKSRKLKVIFHARAHVPMCLPTHRPTRPVRNGRPCIVANMHTLFVDSVPDTAWASITRVLADSRILRHISIQNTAITNKILRKIQVALKVSSKNSPTFRE